MRTFVKKGISFMEHRGLLNWMDDEHYLRLIYWKNFGKKLNLLNPQTFNEKLQWLKLYDRRPEYTKMVDKYEAKKYVASIIGDKYIIPTLGVWDTFDEIDFSKLPDQFVLKCTHDSGGLVICKDKKNLDVEAARKKINNSLKTNYYLHGREWPYKDVNPRIIAEQYLSDLAGDTLDYKVHNFNGIPKMVLVCSERFSELGLKEDFFDTEWRHLDIKRPSHPNSDTSIECPQLLSEMLKVSKVLSESIPFVRTDFYEIGGQLYFGELTFYPASGSEKFEPDKYDEILGEWIKIPIDGGNLKKPENDTDD